MTITKAIDLAMSKPHVTSDQTMRDRALIQLIIARNLPLSFAESEEFKELAAILDPRWVVPGRERVNNLLNDAFNRVHIRLDQDMRKAERISLTMDLWTASSRDGYLGVTATWIDDDYEMNNAVLAFSHVPYPHTGNAIAARIEEVCTHWKIKGKVCSITTDNATNMRGACRKAGIPQVPCTAHTLNLIVQKGLLPAEHLIARVKRLITFFTSPKQGERLEAVQTSINNEQQQSKNKEKVKGKSRDDVGEVWRILID